MARCVVSFVSADRVKHSVTVYASGVLEAAGLAMVAFSSQEDVWMSAPGAGATLEVEVHAPPVTHAVTVDRVTTWLGSSGTPSEMATKNRIRRSLETHRRGQPSHG